MKRISLSLTLLLTAIFVLNAENIITDPTLGYSIYLPGDSWTRVIRNANHHQFYDTTFTYESQVSIVRHPYSSDDFPTPESWTRANFIAYKLSIDYSFDPWAAMLYYDTASTVRQGTGWATESYSTFFSLDTFCGAWSEYTRFTARKDYGWELYAIGDTADMMKNIGTYAAILLMVQLPSDSNARVIPRHIAAGQALNRSAISSKTDRYYDPLGRMIRVRRNRASMPAGLFIMPQKKETGIFVR
ncbi:MAG: hypothetical protein JXA71_11870 [Chitinispirillaceae bacterium]|nr:hypothetical protein [Chitinispirillaceae bacterium]